MRRGIKIILFALTILGIGIITVSASRKSDEHKTLPVGSPAPDFNLMGVDGKMYSLSSFKKAEVLVIIFTCNHCPTAQSYEDRIIKLTADYANKNVAVVAINPNDPKSLRLDELDFSDIGDSFEEMKIRAREKNFNFPYLYDGEMQTTAKAYGPITTPHVFIFDRDRKLRYVGRIDDTENHDKTPGRQDARIAIEALLQNQEVPVKTTKVFGCSVKWSEKRSSVEQALENWAKEPVNLNLVDENGIKTLCKNNSGKLRLINIWSTSNAESMQEFPEFVTINRMYRDRDFEFISISADKSNDLNDALSFLRKQQASNMNYFLGPGDKSRLIQSLDPSWNGQLPYTILVEPGGKIVYARSGVIDPPILKKTIVENHLIGRYP